ncbi:hypothetical protein [Tenacibaculum finnmarkense]|uniref:hypothetical protein n=1 Tax=Tenacibaculum finnmarkense TaxID=2781243 RepID=UPI001E4435B9|nr:hypothetical protein [Tenacibaculum finnmarkense]MCD8417820.1 hypothetical protein [Tenacibaculum finnmarkense genomovar finnmarkense]MCG8186208.1 hypothetical protein [Tenacibaculum finnmarkense genomovar finnmarkense]MCG8203450.1 hypothetical protein [Tenacibaculum finnmarkense genomovar finnmarkense]MCG8208252.1 hypothetical protein [Tenacibaculum finnmarkense genomovar finnmarkense]MCG8210937.1 hypothetical protein [Tenacibaculum finnmarkense genomovar finnmarkense]
MTKAQLSAILNNVEYKRFQKVTWLVVSKNRKRPINEIKYIKNLDNGEVNAILKYFKKEVDINEDEIFV